MFERALLPVDGGSVEVVVGGAGRHAFVTTHPFQYGEEPSALAVALADIGKSIQVTPRGLGGSEEEDDAKIGPLQLVRDLDAVRAALGMGRWIMVGQSGGGYVALAYALEHPSSLAGLVLSCTSADHEIGRASVYHPDNPDNPKVRTALGEGRQGDVRALIAHRPELLSKRLGGFSSRHQAAFRQEMPSLRLPGRLREISLPTLVIVGRHDRAIPAKYGRPLAEHIVGARLIEFEESGHFPYEEEPERFKAVVSDFAERLSDATPAGEPRDMADD